MSFHSRISGTRIKRALGVQAALEWAFRVEQAQLELPPPPDVTEEGFGFGLEYVLLQRGVLGCKIDGGQHKIGGYTREDAEVIAATVAGIPDSLGGKRMAIRDAELARAGLTPDWMPGAVPRCVPTIVKQNQHGTHAGTIVVGTERIRARGAGARATWKTVDILAYPVTFSPHPQQIEAARRGYDDWWQALGWVREGLIAGRMLREVEVTAATPKGAALGIERLPVESRLPFLGGARSAHHTTEHQPHEHVARLLVLHEGAIHDRGYLQANIAGGEGFDWFYASPDDRSQQIRTPITDGAAGKPWVFRYKDLRAWWSNPHFNRPGGVESGSATAWVPQSKPVRFTELGCPAIDRGTNQPNVFFDPKSSESFTPHSSRGWRDDAIQRASGREQPDLVCLRRPHGPRSRMRRLDVGCPTLSVLP